MPKNIFDTHGNVIYTESDDGSFGYFRKDPAKIFGGEQKKKNEIEVPFNWTGTIIGIIVGVVGIILFILFCTYLLPYLTEFIKFITGQKK